MARNPRTRNSISGVATADRLLILLTAFRRGDGAVGLSELAKRTGLVKSTIMRLAISLERYDLLARLPDGNYRLNAGVLRLAAIYQESLHLESHVLPVLRRLVEESRESAAFYIRHGNHRLCLYRVDSPHLLRLHVRPGDMLPMDNSSGAQVLRHYSARSRHDAANGFEVPIYTAGVRDPHTASLAMPVFAEDTQLAGALVLSGPVTRLTVDRAEGLKPKLRARGLELTNALGGTVPSAS
jgi:DNA-binding IclR family transcriptional regulator